MMFHAGSFIRSNDGVPPAGLNRRNKLIERSANRYRHRD